MRKPIVFALFAAFCAILTNGCTKDTAADRIDNIEEFTLISYAAAPDTRMTINGDKQTGFATAWEAGDKIGVYAMPESTEGANSAYFTCNQSHNGTVANCIATFKGTVRSTNKSDYNLFAYYPYTRGSDENDTAYQKGVKCAIATSQTMNGNSFDKSCAYMVAKTGHTINTTYVDNKTINWQFRHTVAFININTKSITTTDVNREEVVERVKIEAVGKTLAGDFLFNLENGAMSFTNPQSAITVNTPAVTKLSDLSAWFVTNPFSLTQSDNFTVTIVTDAHEITKTIHLSQTFAVANVYTLNLTIDSSCTITKRVTYTLTFPDDNKDYNKTSQYDKSWTAKIGDYSWTIANFSNDKWSGWKYIQCGRKSAASVASVSTDWAVAEAIAKVTVKITGLSGVLNSIKLEVATDKAFENVLQTIVADKPKVGACIFTIPQPTPACYYRLLFDCNSGSSDVFVQVSSISYTNTAN